MSNNDLFGLNSNVNFWREIISLKDNHKLKIRENLYGKSYHYLTIISNIVRIRRVRNRSYNTDVYCRCRCGVIKACFLSRLKNSSNISCGCLSREAAKINGKKRSTHGLSRSRIYMIWDHIRARCRNQNNPGWKNYGGRGIEICNEWFDSFPSFYEWAMKNGYEDTLTIDRRDNNLGYNPDNCRWITSRQNSLNRPKRRSVNSTSRYKGVSWSKQQNKWKVGIKNYSEQMHLGYFEHEIDAAKAYDKKAREIFGDYACLNFYNEADK